MITISETALKQLKPLMAEQNGAPDDSNTAVQTLGLRVFVEAGGCSGFSYGMGFDENPPTPEDTIVEVEGISIYVDGYSAQYLEGAEIDYIDQLMGGGFTIHNPNAVKSCSCGQSFQTADGAGEARACSH